MLGSGIQNHSESFLYPQTRNLPLEIWQEIFWLASSIEDTDEFTTDPRAYNRTVWNRWDKENVVKAETTLEELNIALQTRLNITRVSKAWYSMGIEILYSHIRVIPRLWDDLASQRLLQNPQLLSHTKRLTIVPQYRYRHTNARRDADLARVEHLCINLPQLRFLDASGDTLVFFPYRSLPTSLEVMIARGRREYLIDSAFPPVPPEPLHAPWCNTRVLKVDLHTLGVLLYNELQPRPGLITFASVEELSFNDGHLRAERVAKEVFPYISKRWKFPKLRTLSIRRFHWPDWWDFLEANSQTLKSLSLTTNGDSFSPRDKERIEFPELEGFYLDDRYADHTIVAGKVTRVGWDGLVFDEQRRYRTMPTEVRKPRYLRRLLWKFNRWRNFPAATTYSVAGWHEILEWLEQQPEVIERVAELQKCGIEVEFIRIYGNSQRCSAYLN